MIRVLKLLSAFLYVWPAVVIGQVAVDDTQLDDPALEAKAREIMGEIRCLVCQNQPISSSNAGLAQDLRIIVREQVADGRSEAEIKAFLVERYGDWVLLKPPLNPRTVALWSFPPLILLVVGFAAWMRAKRKHGRPAGPAPLSAEEQARLDALMDDEGRP